HCCGVPRLLAPRFCAMIPHPAVCLTRPAPGEGASAVRYALSLHVALPITGNVTLGDITVTDDNAEIVAGSPVATLAPGASATVIARKRARLNARDARKAEDDACVTGNDPSGAPSPAVGSAKPATRRPDDPP